MNNKFCRQKIKIKLSLRSCRLEVTAQKITRRERDRRSFLRPLLPIACYAGQLKVPPHYKGKMGDYMLQSQGKKTATQTNCPKRCVYFKHFTEFLFRCKIPASEVWACTERKISSFRQQKLSIFIVHFFSSPLLSLFSPCFFLWLGI